MFSKIKSLFQAVKPSQLLAIGLLTLSVPSVSQASAVVSSGWDLFTTVSGTVFNGAAFEGVALGEYDFGGTIGKKNVGATDTIVRRSNPTITGPSTMTFDLEMVAMQLKSTSYYLTLQSSQASTGSMTINFGTEPANLMDQHGTFSSFFDIFFDLRVGGLDGDIINSDNNTLGLPNYLRLTSNNAPWAHQPPPRTIEIEGVNTILNGTDRSTDFFPIGEIEHNHASYSTTHKVKSPVPEPTTIPLFALGLLALVGFAKRRKS